MTEKRDPEKIVREIKRKAHSEFSNEEKIRIVKKDSEAKRQSPRPIYKATI